MISVNLALFSELQNALEPIHDDVNSENHAAKVSFKSNVHSKDTEIL